MLVYSIGAVNAKNCNNYLTLLLMIFNQIYQYWRYDIFLYGIIYYVNE